MKSIKPSDQRDLQIFLEDFYSEIAYDGSPEFKDYVPKGVWFTLYEDDLIAGLINLEPLNNVTWIPHIMIYETCRGKGSEEWGNIVVRTMCTQFGAKKFLAFTPYEAAKKYAERMGFKQIGKLSNSILKNGKLLSQYMLELGTLNDR